MLWLYNFVTSTGFEGFIMGVILANVGVMACDYWGIDKHPTDHMRYRQANRIFAYVFYCEAAPRSWPRLRRLLWRRVVSLRLYARLHLPLDQFAADILAQFLPVPPMLLRALRILRIVRILRLLKAPRSCAT